MLTYLLGDVLRIFAGDAKLGEIEGVQGTQGTWLLIAVIMLGKHHLSHGLVCYQSRWIAYLPFAL
jgi:hypothetical protein